MGSYVQALPVKALKDEASIDIVFTNEGVYALKNLLNLKDFDEEFLNNISGIAFRNGNKIKINPPEKIVSNETSNYLALFQIFKEFPDLKKHIQ